MHGARARWPSSNGRTYESICLRESFRQDGKVKKRDIANLTHCDPAEIAAIELALKLIFYTMSAEVIHSPLVAVLKLA